MTKGHNKPRYEPPVARDLSSVSVSGQMPLGSCTYGTRPWYACELGSGFDACNPSGGLPDTSRCDAGGFHTQPTCDFGQSAVTACLSGAVQNF